MPNVRIDKPFNHTMNQICETTAFIHRACVRLCDIFLDCVIVDLSLQTLQMQLPQHKNLILDYFHYWKIIVILCERFRNDEKRMNGSHFDDVRIWQAECECESVSRTLRSMIKLNEGTGFACLFSEHVLSFLLMFRSNEQQLLLAYSSNIWIRYVEWIWAYCMHTM